MADLIAHRYPGTRPSQLMGVTTEWEAFQLDAALARKAHDEEQDKLMILVRAIYKSQGMDIKENRKTELDQSPANDEPEYIPTVDEVFQALGVRKGTIIEH